MFDSRVTREWRFRTYPKHELLGTRVSETTYSEPVWRNVLFLDHTPWIRDHKIKGDVIFPCAGYVGMVDYGGYAMRNVFVGSAMVLSENKGAEIVTSLKKVNLTDSLESNWWDFTVSSHNGTPWTKHCTGQVCAKNSEVPKLQESWALDRTERLPRKVVSSKWYQSFRNVGANYGPFFQGLTQISCGNAQTMAEGTVISTTEDDEAIYAVHPTKIGFMLQLGVADAKGVGHAVSKMVVPTNIDFLEVRDVADGINMRVLISSTVRGGIFGNADGLDKSGSAVHQMKDAELDTLDELALQNATKLFAKFQKRIFGNAMRPELEYAVVDGQISLPRVYPMVVNDVLAGGNQDSSVTIVHIQITCHSAPLMFAKAV